MSALDPALGSRIEVSGGIDPASPSIPPATLYYELRGSGPLIALAGTPDGTEAFAGLADLMATGRTVLTYDPRGTGRSVSHDDDYDDTPELRAYDLYQLLSAVTDQPVDLFGGSGGAMTGLALATAHPARIRTLVAHEPPVTTVLPDADQLRARIDDVVAAFHAAGAAAAWTKFLATTGMTDPAEPGDLGAAPTAEPMPDSDGDYFLSRMLPHTPRYHPDLAALRAASTRIVIGVGASSGDELPRRAALALADRLHDRVVDFPGDHIGYLTHPEQFSGRLHQLLRE